MLGFGHEVVELPLADGGEDSSKYLVGQTDIIG